MIRSFRDRDTAKIFCREFSRRLNGIASAGKRKLDHLNAAVALADLQAIPGNHLESLGRDRKGQYSIRINGQWRICFRWREPDAYDVEIVDYH